MKPPVIHDALFDQLKTDNPDLITKRFHNLYAMFRDYFNDPASCLADIQQIRKQCGVTPKSLTTIFPSELKPEWDGGYQWYAYHYGGRSEPQFNIGMEAHRPDRDAFRVGLGFEFTPLASGKPELVKETFAAFTEVITDHEKEFYDFVIKNNLKIHWIGKDWKTGKLASGEERTGDVVKWLKGSGNAREWTWVFVGRFLRRGLDRAVLEDADRFGDVIESVISGFKPFWQDTLYRVSGRTGSSPFLSKIRRRRPKP